MAKLPDKAVKQLIKEVSALNDLGHLRPDDLERIKSAFAEPDPDRRLQKMDALLREAEHSTDEIKDRLAGMRRQYGMEDKDPGDKFTDEGRAMFKQAIDGLAASAASDARREAKQALSGPRTGRAMPLRAGRIRV